MKLKLINNESVNSSLWRLISTWFILGGALGLLTMVHSTYWLIILLPVLGYLSIQVLMLKCLNCGQSVVGFSKTGFGRLNEFVFGFPVKCSKCGKRY